LSSFSSIFFDFNDDLYPDLFVAIDHTSDEFFWNRAGAFVNATAEVGATHTGNDMGVACSDLDDDGDLDLFVTNITDPSHVFGTTQYNALNINTASPLEAARFSDEAALRGVHNTYWGWGTKFVDVENDGDLDLIAVTGFDEYVYLRVGPGSPVYRTPSVLLINDGTGRFSRLQSAGLDDPDDSRALIAFDYDRDGDEDLLVTNVNQPARLLENIGSPQGHWLQVELRQSIGENRNGIGASVFAAVAGVTKRRDIIVGDSYLAGSPAEVHFGLGSASRLDVLQVKWTDGTESSYTNVVADRFVRIVQGVPDADVDGDPDGVDNCPAMVNPGQENQDSDSRGDLCDNCPGVPNDGQINVDGDPAGDACDCDSTDNEVWAIPSDPVKLTLDGQVLTALTWQRPAEPGCNSPIYDALRSPSASQFASATVVATNIMTTSAYDAASPAISSCLFYIVRAKDSCGVGASSSRESGTSWRLLP